MKKFYLCTSLGLCIGADVFMTSGASAIRHVSITGQNGISVPCPACYDHNPPNVNHAVDTIEYLLEMPLLNTFHDILCETLSLVLIQESSWIENSNCSERIIILKMVHKNKNMLVNFDWVPHGFL